MLATIEFNDCDFLVTTVAHNFSGNFTAFNNGLTDLDVFAVANQQDPVELDSFACGSLNFFQLEGLALNYAVLLATGFDNCVHCSLRLISPLAVEKTL